MERQMLVSDAVRHLGLSSTDDLDVKAHFRRLSRVYHPDNLETGDSARFQDISEAYKTLRGLAESDLLNAVMEFILSSRPEDKGEDYSARKEATCLYYHDIPMADVLNRSEIWLEPGRTYPCARCNGDGKEPTPDACVKCGGKGGVVQSHLQLIVSAPCSACAGEGRNYAEKCYGCGGTGGLKVEERICLGHSNGQEVDQFIQTSMVNPLNDKPVIICVRRIIDESSAGIRISRGSILVEHKVPFKLLDRGGSTSITLPSGIGLDIDIAPKTPARKRIAIADQGFYRPDGTRGKLLVQLGVDAEAKKSGGLLGMLGL